MVETTYVIRRHCIEGLFERLKLVINCRSYEL
jgi:hypothetical protein